ncbi:unnamed protein product [Didymodactylos carnosus]|uniref:Fucosyltransferase n=1 Tax=Didymodactylos carnosus TaxID=1234261 RepID=A0A813ZJP2_9BILA|nr:unnamed protein product [Didymodactylos carnosus]CAF0921977.1 unnamed protein product [Didymodactylos carnosus]CAF3681632.1 unnamed protein product [Didymodactylos carnosus]CAF3699374.1 unnamed protein product [Didymodactylos carnosus]
MSSERYRENSLKSVSLNREITTEPKLILLYTTVFGNGKYCSWSSEQIFGVTCPYQCIWSCKRREHFSTADAIIFHAYDIETLHQSVPDRQNIKKNAVFILWSDEPATMINYKQFNKYHFNWTISYKLDSEVSIASYGVYSALEKKSNKVNKWIYNQFHQRQTSALWFVSNCDAIQRLTLYNKLKKIFPINGYGRCVDYYPTHWCKPYTPCEKNYMIKYKYYLSFESNTCSSYVTEKFWRALYFGLIPIVYGPKKEDYINIAPPSSFIHVDEFHSLNDLSKYLYQVGNNHTLYASYHQWRAKYSIIIDGKALDQIRMCELCKRLMEQKSQTRYYNNIFEYFNEGCEK